MKDYKNIIKKREVAYKIILDGYSVEVYLFKKDITWTDYLNNLLTTYKNNKDMFYSDYELNSNIRFFRLFSGGANVFYSFIAVIEDLLTIERIKAKTKKEFSRFKINFNENELNVSAVKTSDIVYAVINDTMPICISRHSIIISISILNNRLNYHFLSSIDEAIIGIKKHSDNMKFIGVIKKEINNEGVQ